MRTGTVLGPIIDLNLGGLDKWVFEADSGYAQVHVEPRLVLPELKNDAQQSELNDSQFYRAKYSAHALQTCAFRKT